MAAIGVLQPCAASLIEAALHRNDSILPWIVACSTSTDTHLISAEVAEARGAIEFYRRDKPDGLEATRKVLGPYFDLLWAFEYVLAGREALSRMRRVNTVKPALDYLDSMTRWHIEEWNRRWPKLRAQIQNHLEDDLDDHHSLESFCKLVCQVTGETDEVRTLRSRMQQEDDERRRRRQSGQVRSALGRDGQ
ncbi:hypothetical protein [Streptomyces coffeae]|uniref:Uncharacterized protein n=1 Tax=Streptomyces coffeae TaxID=621382 RepID=A0ABS1N5K7_9ACTN|nr:hypothetical protein [Streptomyces coffeae]MBL1095171.1 hypothetical protein [Streptomyces coffeae]